MIFVSRLAIPLGTTEAARITEKIEPPLPIVRDVLILFEGAKVDAGIRLMDRSSLMIPAMSSPDQWVRHNAQPIAISMLHYKLQQDPYEIVVEGYNNGAANIDVDIYLTCEAWDPEEMLLNEIRGLREDLKKMGAAAT